MIDAPNLSLQFLPGIRPSGAERPLRQDQAQTPTEPRPDRAADEAEKPGRPPAPLAVPPLNLSNQTTAQEQGAGDQAFTGQPLAPANQATAQDDAAEEQAPNGQPLAPDSAGGNGEEEEGPDGLTEAERQEVEKLKARDREVRAHEQAHKLAGGSLAGQPTYETVRGPDGRQYAVSGEVKIDTSTVPNNPEATIRKMEIVKRAALAPAQPSAQDRRVAAEAEAKAQQARQEKREEETEERKEAQAKRENSPFSVSPVQGPGSERQGGQTGNGPNSIDNGGNAAPRGGAGLGAGSLLNLIA